MFLVVAIRLHLVLADMILAQEDATKLPYALERPVQQFSPKERGLSCRLMVSKNNLLLVAY